MLRSHRPPEPALVVALKPSMRFALSAKEAVTPQKSRSACSPQLTPRPISEALRVLKALRVLGSSAHMKATTCHARE